jgi:hypothetical protein
LRPKESLFEIRYGHCLAVSAFFMEIEGIALLGSLETDELDAHVHVP